MNYLSVCSGIEAASVAWHPLGWKPVAFSEIEKFPSAVLAHHYPDVPNLGDMTKFHEWPELSINLLVGGTPCQAFSVAGLRAGLADPRGNLTLTFLGVAEKYRPEWICWENVPGVLSDKTRALHHFLDGLNELGYVCDIEILDAQFHGLAQRRRRVFVCAQNVDSLLSENSDMSALTIAQCLIETLHAICIAGSTQFAAGAESSGSARLSKDGATRRMKLFGLLTQPEKNWPRLLGNLDVAVVRCLNEQNNSAYCVGESEREHTPEDPLTDLKTEARSILTDPQWKQSLEDAFSVAKSFITSTSTNTITEAEISTCSKAVLNIGRLIALSNPLCPAFWQAASSFLTATQDATNYARQTNSEISGDISGVHPWADFTREAEQYSDAIGDIGIECFGEILSVAEGMCWHPAPSREERKGVAPCLAARTKGGGGLGTDFDCDGGVIPIQEIGKRQSGTPMNGVGHGAPGDPMYTLQSSAVHGVLSPCLKGNGGKNSDAAMEASSLVAHSLTGFAKYTDRHPTLGASGGDQGGGSEALVVHSLRAEGFDASEDGTGRGTPLVPVIAPSLTANYGKQPDSSDTSKGPMLIPSWPAEIAPTLNAHFGEKQGLEDQHALGGGGCSFPPKISLCLNAGAMGRSDAETETLIPTRQGGFFDERNQRFLCHNCGRKFGIDDYPRNPCCPDCHCMTVDDLLQGDSFPAGTKLAFAVVGDSNFPEPIAFNHNAQAAQLPSKDRDTSLNDGLTCSQGAAVAWQEAQTGCREYPEAGTLRANGPGHDPVGTRIRQGMSVRRLTPTECERLQGFPDGYTNIPWRKQPASPDGPRYKALGNSMAVPCMRWIGERIQAVRTPMLNLD